jgi:hypothetical protein
MATVPKALGLTLCQQVIVEERTRRVTLVNNFAWLRLGDFPATYGPFSAVAALTDGQGAIDVTIRVERTETLDLLYHQTQRLVFRSPFHELVALFRFPRITFPVPGGYEFSIWAGGEALAYRVLRVS